MEKQLLLGIIMLVSLVSCQQQVAQLSTSNARPYTNPKGFQTENVFFITFDGLRWQEMFTGADSIFFDDVEFVKNGEEVRQRFWNDDSLKRRELLLPFFWNTIVKEGQIYGNRAYGSKVNCSNNFWFSYPGYNEMLSGYADPKVNSNDKNYNENITFLEHFNKMKALKGSVAAFGSWDVFPYIINDKRSGVPVNAGFASATGSNLTEREKFLNEMQPQVPSPWSTVRLDAFTHHYALEFIKKNNPRAIYISYGETDDFAHDGNYEAYLKSAYQTDAFIKELWNYCQSHPQYKGKTTFVIATDHGRGYTSKAAWRSHGKSRYGYFKGSDEMWFAAIGPDTPALGEIKTAGQYYQKQTAKTIAAFMGIDFDANPDMGEVIAPMFK